MKHPITGFEHLHLHSDFSIQDGYGMVEEYAARAKQINQQFLCVTDHGVMGAIPRQIRACEDHSRFPLFGCELYLNPMQVELKQGEKMGDYLGDDPADRERCRKSYHLLAIAYNETGYKNLVNLSSWGWIKGFYYKPRINHEQLIKHKEGLIFTSCCYNSEIGQAFDKGGEEAGFQKIEDYMEMFGENFYLEFMLLDFVKQKPYNAFIMKAHDKYGLPLIVTQDCHYCSQEDSHMQRLMLMIQTNRTIQDIQRAVASNEMTDFFELQDQNLWMKSEDELNQKWESDYKDIIDYELFKQAKENTVRIANMAKGVKLDRSIKLPEIPDDNPRLMDAVLQGFKDRNMPMNPKYMARVKEEYELIKEKEFASYFLIQKMMTDEARRSCEELLGWGAAEAVGPGRGSAVGSLICYALGITDVDPIEHDLLFSRFLSRARGGKRMKVRFTSDPLGHVEEVEECPF